MDIADLLELQAALHTDGIINASANEERIPDIHNLGGKPLKPLLILQNTLYLIGNGLNFIRQTAESLLRDLPSCLCKLHSQQICRNQLTAVCLGGGNRDFRARQGIEYIVRFSCNGGTHHVDDTQGSDPLVLAEPECRQAVRRFTGLADDNGKAVGNKLHAPVAELRSQLHPYLQAGQLLQHILSRHAYMVSRTAGYNVNLLNLPHIFISKTDAFKAHLSVLQNGMNGIPHNLGLLVDLLEHKMLIAALFRSLCVPFDGFHFLLDLVPVQVIKRNRPLGQPCKLQIADIIHVSGILENRRHVGGQIAFTAGYPDNHRAVFSGCIDLPGIILEHHRQCIGTPDPDQGMIQCVHRGAQILLVVIVNQLDCHFRIRLGAEGIPLLGELLPELLIIFNNAVMYRNDVFIIAAVGMGIDGRGLSVGCPPGMTDAAGSLYRLAGIGHLLQHLQLALCFDNFRLGISVPDCNAGRVIASVFQLGQPVKKDGRRLIATGKAYDSAHRVFSSTDIK